MLEELAELDALLERLTLKRYDLRRKINQLHSPIIRRLPPDVTSTIFEFCLPYFEDNQLYSYTEDTISIPLSLGAICTYWREIAWSTPSLWSSLVVFVPNNPSIMATGLAQEWLDRSGQLPLSIRIISTSYNNAISEVVEIVNQYSNRWSELDLYIPDYYYHDFHATNNHAPILKFIRFHCSKNAMGLDFQPLTCPRLEKAVLSFYPTGTELDNLTHLTLDSMSIFDSFLILRTTPRLVFFEILGPCSESIEPRPGALVLPSLRTLRLITDSADYFLNNLIAPHLEEFKLPAYYIPSMEIVTSFLRRSACSLRSFTVMVSIFPPYFEGLMSLLESLPSLDSLSLVSITTTLGNTNLNPSEYDPRNILQLVARVLSSQSTSLQQGFLPNLKILKYTGELYLRPGNYDDLYPLPPADNAVHGPLHLLKLNLYPTYRVPQNLISYISNLMERGVTVNVVSRSEDILQSSINYYRLRKDSSDRDWTDNLDSSLFF